MELNLMTTDAVFANMNIVFDDSIFQVDEDKTFGVYVSNGFNSSITFPSYANKVFISGNPYNLNCPINIPNSVTDMSSAFYSCSNFNQPITIPNSVKYANDSFRGSGFNQPITIPEGVEYMVRMFYQSKFNQSLVIPSSMKDAGDIFFWDSNFNSPVTLQDTEIGYFGYIFHGTGVFNQPVTIPESAVVCNYMFDGASKFNQPINIPANVNNAAYMLSSCYELNQPVTFNGAPTYTSHMFDSSRNFNQFVVIPKGVRFCDYMFNSITKFNSTVIIPDTVINTQRMFDYVNSCPYNTYNSRYGVFDNSAMKQPIYYFANNTTDASYMLSGCNSMTTLYLKGVQNNTQLTRFIRENGGVRCNIYTDEISKNLLSTTPLLANGAKPVWTNDATNNCIYNTACNLYIYNTWDGIIPNFCRLQYFSNTGYDLLQTEYISSGGNGTYEYGSNEWSNEPNGQPVSNILNNITTNMNVYYAGSLVDTWVRQKYQLTADTFNARGGNFSATLGNSGIILNSALVAGVSFKATDNSYYIQTGACQNTATLPGIIGTGAGRINFSTAKQGTYATLPYQDIFLGGQNFTMDYIVTLRDGVVPDNGIRIMTQDTGSGNASLNVRFGVNEPEVLAYQNASSGVNYAELVQVKYASSWSVTALANVTDGINNYNAGDTIRTWGYSTLNAFTIWSR